MNIDDLLDAIRDLIGQADPSIPERDLYDALVGESDGWRMRLEEIESE